MQDSPLLALLIFLAGCGAGAFVVWLSLNARLRAEARLVDTFKALAADTLNQNSAAFLQLAEGKLKQTEQAAASTLHQKSVAIDEMVKPVKETLQRVDAQLQAMEIKREGAYRELAEMVTSSRETQLQLRNETSQLLQALRAPTGRGRWGELQLQRILEMTGMSTHAKDFSTQTTLSNDDGTIRPDVIVSLPGTRCVVIDSKVPLSAYLDAVQSSNEETRLAAMKAHAKQVKDHIKKLGNKAYWEQIEGTPEFVVLFMPGEHFLSAALDGDPDIMEYSTGFQVVLATPMTLIALLRTISYGWRQEALRENVMQIAEMGRKLHGALNIFASQMQTLGSRIGGTVETYNKTIGALERNVFAKARQLATFGTASSEDELPILEPIERETRLLSLPADQPTETEETPS